MHLFRLISPCSWEDYMYSICYFLSRSSFRLYFCWLWCVFCVLSQLKQAWMKLLFWRMFQITPNGLTPINALGQTVMRLCLFIKLSSFICPVFLKGLNSPPLVEEKTKHALWRHRQGQNPLLISQQYSQKYPGLLLPGGSLMSLGFLQMRCWCWHRKGTEVEKVIGTHIQTLSVPSFPTFGNAQCVYWHYLCEFTNLDLHKKN